MEINISSLRDFFLGLQDRITTRIASVDGNPFIEDAWTKAEDSPLQGDGRSRLLEGGNIFERAGVGFSHVRGSKLPPSATQNRPELTGRGFEAIGVSLVFHPRNPYIPTVHMNVRAFVAKALTAGAGDIWWFGGGMDLTPYYPFDEDAVHFHKTCRNALTPFGDSYYPRFKKWCDEYFFLQHRDEPRGIGGIFYDRLNPQSTGLEWLDIFEFSKAVGRTFLPVYVELINRNKNKLVKKEDKLWQYQRRSRYAEFNLVYDAGTKFGLETNGRIESILMSLPPQANWVYNFNAKPDSEEEKTLSLLKKGINWI